MTELATLERPQRSIFLTATVHDNADLATEDPLALDYVGQQIGLMLLPTLTTRSSRAQGFAMVLYGLDLAEQAIRRYGLPATDEQRRMLFEQWERFWALATLECKDGYLARGDRDRMRGFRGASKAWRAGGDHLPLSFQLISRQQELGNLGAYLAPLRRMGLVRAGTLHPTPAATEIIAAFWAETDENSHASRYEEYSLLALEPGRTRIERKSGNLKLSTVGDRSRLTSLRERERVRQQQRLFESLLQFRRDHTQSVAALVQRATEVGIFETRPLLDAAIRGELGAVSGELSDVLATARAFGDVFESLLGGFDRAYTALGSAGWVASQERVAVETWPREELLQMHERCSRFLSAPCVLQVRGLPAHGRALVAMLEELQTAGAESALSCLLAYHGQVMRERRRGQGWIRSEGDRLLLGATNYRPRESARFPTFKLDVVHALLVDVGRLPLPQLSDEEEEA